MSLMLDVKVPEGRDRTAVATLSYRSYSTATGQVVASATPSIAARHGNPDCDPLRMWGHPPFGDYRLLRYAPVDSELASEYGTYFLLFEPESGQALDAESFGRLGLLAYGGPAGRDGRMRRTQGGLRLDHRMMQAIVEKLKYGSKMRLRLTPLAPPAWWQFWRRGTETPFLSDDLPGPFTPPRDEGSLFAALAGPTLEGRRRRRTGRQRDDSRDRDDDRNDDRDGRQDRSSSGRDSGSARESVQGKGGESAGAGASGGWDSAPGRNPGVDQAGRIVAGAVAAAGLAAIVNEAAGARSGGDDASGISNAGETSGSDSGSDGHTSTTTSTAY